MNPSHPSRVRYEMRSMDRSVVRWTGAECSRLILCVISRAVQPWARVWRLVLRLREMGRNNSFPVSINCYLLCCWFIQPRIVISSPRCGRWKQELPGSCLHEMLCSLAKKCTRPALPEHYLSANVSKFLGNINWKVSNSTWNNNLNLIWSCDTLLVWRFGGIYRTSGKPVNYR